MADTIVLHGVEVELSSGVGHEFVVDCVRAGEGLLRDEELCQIYEVTPQYLREIAGNKLLGNAIRVERDHRVRSGIAARESAARHFVRAPNILAAVMDNEQSNPRHKIESIKTLHQIATPQNQNSPAQSSEKFVIRIDLSASPGGEIEEFEIDINNTPPELPPERPRLTVISNDGADNE